MPPATHDVPSAACAQRVIPGLVAVAATLMLACLAAPVAQAKPYVSFKTPRAAAAGNAVWFVYAIRDLTRTQRVVVQQRRARTHAWRTTLRLSRTGSASTRFSGLPRGSYRLRIVALARSGSILSQQQQGLRVVAFSRQAAATQSQQSDWLEQQRYAVETMNLTYTQYVARQSDFRAQGCTNRWPEQPQDPPTWDHCNKPPPYNSFDWTDDGCSGRDQIKALSNVYRNLFNEPCRQHDFAYRNLGKGLTLDHTESRRAWIDNRFKAEMKSLCNNNFAQWWQAANKQVCLKEADGVYTTVHLLSDWSTYAAPKPSAPRPGPAAAVAPTQPSPPAGAGATLPLEQGPTAPSGSPPAPPPPPTYAETTGGIAHTWTNYTNAGGTEGPSIPSNATVQIACKLPGFRVADGNTWWYRIASSPWNGAFFVSADAFYNNGQTAGSLHGTPFVDPNIRDC